MYDQLEQIKLRIVTLLGGVAGIIGVHRDRGAIPPEDPTTNASLLPAIIFLDGVERSVDPKRSVRGKMQPSLEQFEPEIFIVLKPSLSPENTGIGEALSNFRALILKAVTTDPTLMNLLGEEGGIAYLGHDTDMQAGQDIRGQMRLNFCFYYIFYPPDLN